MANKRITQLDQFTGNPAANDVFVFVENSSLSTYKITYSNLLSSNNILVNSVYTNVRDNSASWEESAIIAPLQSASANWNNTYNNVSTSSANWNNTYTQFSTNSATYATIGFANGKFLPLSGGDLTGNITSTGIVSTNNDAYFASLSTTGVIIAPSVGSVIPFYFANQAAFPSAATYHGAIAHSHATGAMYFAHGGAWIELAKKGVVDGKFLPLSGGDLTGNITSTGTISTNNDASFASLSTLNINVNNFSNTVGVSAGVYLSITVSGSAFKIPLYLV